ncbi:MAG: hypothetical protein E7309_15175 [Butyrivibrio sp.]|jgi:uncharacterized membrane protein|nr:hypothetical protein [Butyrivibrio sp.]
MIPRKKNSFATFVCSFMPGAAEMYMGFMKNGLSIMLIFLLCFMALSLGFGDIFGAFATIAWFFGFFHARNYASLSDEELGRLGDVLVWDELMGGTSIKYNSKAVGKWVAASFIVVGVCMLWSNISELVYRLIPDAYWDMISPMVEKVPQLVIAVLLIVVGIKLIQGKKKELELNTDFPVITCKEETEDAKNA